MIDEILDWLTTNKMRDLQNPTTDTFIDGVTRMGPWAIMCPTCHKSHGKGLGTGQGQRYQLKEGKWTNESTTS